MNQINASTMKPRKPRNRMIPTPIPVPAWQASLLSFVAWLAHLLLAPPAIAQMRMRTDHAMIAHVIFRQCLIGSPPWA